MTDVVDEAIERLNIVEVLGDMRTENLIDFILCDFDTFGRDNIFQKWKSISEQNGLIFEDSNPVLAKSIKDKSNVLDVLLDRI